MALSDSVTYNGTIADKIIAPLFYDNTIFSQFTIHEGITYKEQIVIQRNSGHAKADQCGFTASGTIALTSKDLTVCGYAIQEQICGTTIDAGFLNERRRNGMVAEPVPQEYSDFLVGKLAEEIGNTMQNELWNGVAGATSGLVIGLCNGLLAQFGATSSGVIGLTGLGGATAGSVVNILNAMVAGATGTIQTADPSKIKIYAAPNVVVAYRQSLGAQGNNTTQGAKTLDFNGYEIIPAPKMPASNLVMVDPTNIHIGNDLGTDQTSILVKDMTESTLERAIRYAAYWKFGVVFGIGEEIVWYKP